MSIQESLQGPQQLDSAESVVSPAVEAVKSFVLTGVLEVEQLTAVQELTQGAVTSANTVVRIACQMAMDDPMYRGNDEALMRMRDIYGAFVTKTKQPNNTGPVRSPQKGRHASKADSGDDVTWEDFAACLGMDGEKFFPEKGTATREAKKECQGCTVRGECLEYALVNNLEHGVWGGTSARERRRIRKQRAMARAIVIPNF